MTPLQVAICIAIRHQPDYKFSGNELAAAERMVKRGLLKKNDKGNYIITPIGVSEYRKAT